MDHAPLPQAFSLTYSFPVFREWGFKDSRSDLPRRPLAK
jgi:hypothetical protein